MGYFPKFGNLFTRKHILNNMHKGLDSAIAVVFNILWLIQSGPTALFTGSIDIV